MAVSMRVCGAAALSLAMPAAAQVPANCPGTLEVIRFGQLKPGRTLAEFQSVVDRHMAWYRRHGYTANRQVVAPVMTLAGESKTDFVTIHYDAPGLTQADHDAAWEEFVDAYRQVSTVQGMRTVCVPKR